MQIDLEQIKQGGAAEGQAVIWNNGKWRPLSAGGGGYGQVRGLFPSNTAGALTTSVTLSSGACRDSTDTYTFEVLVPINCPLDAVWTAGVGGRFPDVALANAQSWHLHLIYDATNKITSRMWSQSPANPQLPTGYTLCRRVFSITLEAASTAIRQFGFKNNIVSYDVRTTDFINATDNQATGMLRDFLVPRGLTLRTQFWYTQTTSTGSPSTNPVYVGLFDPDEPIPTFGVPTQYGEIRINWDTSDPSNSRYFSGKVWQNTNSNAQVYSVCTDTTGVMAAGVLGWEEPRDLWA